MKKYGLTLVAEPPGTSVQITEANDAREIADALTEAQAKAGGPLYLRLTDMRWGLVLMLVYDASARSMVCDVDSHPEMAITRRLETYPNRLRDIEIYATTNLGAWIGENGWRAHSDEVRRASGAQQVWDYIRSTHIGALRDWKAALARRDRTANLLGERLTRQITRRLGDITASVGPIGGDLPDEDEGELYRIISALSPRHLADALMPYLPITEKEAIEHGYEVATLALTKEHSK